ncbi:TonB-dependent receptor [Asticcacaulis sp. SL142]|uniref:TonB-dependent receptor n=1 Tax=Asticcacaulis sp. SL142 TaxID=2995155 RepID=UPI00226C83A1|nr:TonB-dependent receptor [Asticcacaulis sp. SL142]WAC48469.1 TonB-dependent receptor [Asticcacaulis sp. SL142]
MSKSNSSLWSSAALSVLALSLVSGAAYAQEATETAVQTNDSDVQEVVVRGFRKSLGQARALKRNSDVVADVIVAEDMAKFPDLNLAESLQRLPGVAINREGGEGRRVSLRGLGPDFTRVQLNGMEVLGNVDSPMDSRGQTSRDRAFDFNLFASDLFNKVDVKKSFSAEQDEGGMAGTVGLYTAKPFDYKTGLKGAFSLQGGTNTNTEDFQKRGAGMLSWNHEGKFGALISVAYGQRDTQEQGYNTYGAGRQVATAANVVNLSPEDQTKARAGQLVFQRGNRLSVWGSEQERLGITAALQWRPIENLTFTLDALHGEFTNDRDELHLATRASVGSTILGNSTPHSGSLVSPAPVLNSIQYDKYNSVVYADVENTVFATETRRQTTENTFDQFVLSGNWQVSDKLNINGHLGKETSDYDIPVSDKFYMEAFGGLITDYRVDQFYAKNTYKWDTTDPNNYRAHEIDFSSTYQSTELENAELNGAYEVRDDLTIKAGLSFRGFTNSGRQYTNDNVLLSSWQNGSVDDRVTNYYKVFTDHDDQDWVIADFDKALENYNITRTVNLVASSNYSVTEDTNAAYIQMDWKGDLFGKPVRGNVGMRGYETELTSKGFMSVNGATTPVTSSKSYSGTLPSFNAVMEISDSFQVRAAVAQNLNRPSLTSYALNGSVSLDETANTLTVSTGNPNLEPYTSDEFDLAGEWYFGGVGMVTAGVFHKKIDGFIVNKTESNIPYSQTGLPTDLVDGLTADSNVTTYTRPINAKDAKLTGLEISGQTDFFFLPAPFNNFGVVANMTFIKSEMETNNLYGSLYTKTEKTSIYGMSDVNHNLTIYYETSTWGARVSENFRSDYLIDGGGFASTTYVDAAAFWQITPSIRLTLDGINLTDEKEIQYNSYWPGAGETGAKRLWNTTTSGKTVFVGVSMQF